MDRSFTCVKCGGTEFTQDQMRATGGFLAKIFDVQNKKFVTVSCAKCGYTELYKGTSSMLGNIFDLFSG
jgi:predicted nucleic-acid-binding Zn-ribbon protein